MAVLIDPPRWPAHGTVFAHLVSDTSLEELHAFATAAGIPPRAFDHDHYDVPERRYPDLVARGAVPVSANELVRRLIGSGLRTRTPQRTPKRSAVIPRLAQAWDDLLPGRPELGAELLTRWSEPHRHYHDVRHLAQCLEALARIGAEETVARPVQLAAWFHDAVYQRRPGDDEEASAVLAEDLLRRAGLGEAEIREVARLIRLTVGHLVSSDDRNAAQLSDADLSILGQSRGRYHVYVRDVRLEYPELSDDLFRTGRLQVIDHLRRLEPLYRTATGRGLWAEAAQRNLAEERHRWADPD